MSDLDQVTRRLGERHKAYKIAEKEKNESRKEFFELADERPNEEATIIAVEEAPTLEQATELINQKHPMMEVIGVRGGDGRYEFELRIQNQYRAFTYVNQTDGMVYTKQVVEGALHLDEERLLNDNPELYERVTYVPEPERKLKDQDEIDEEDLMELADYLFSGRPTIKLAAPRKAKPEELE